MKNYLAILLLLPFFLGTAGTSGQTQFQTLEEWRLVQTGTFSLKSIHFIDADDESYPSGRWAMNGEYKVIPDKILMFHSHEGFVGMEDADDFLILTEQGMRLTLIKDFYFNFQVNIDYDHSPAPGKEETDTTIIAGLGYSFEL